MQGKKILVLGGSAREIIDGVRYYTNHARPEDHGLQAAILLAGMGAEVALLTPPMHGKKPEGIIFIEETPDHTPIISTKDLLSAAASKPSYDAVLHLANVPAIRPARQSEYKLKVKKEAGALIPMDVTGNTDMEQELRQCFSQSTIAGYTNYQEWFSTSQSPMAHALEEIALQASQAAASKSEAHIVSTAHSNELSGRTILVTSGPTIETISTSGDAISNLSSGKQGHAIALSLAALGAKVILITGPSHLPDPMHPAITTLHTQSARDMHDTVLAQLPVDAYIGVAAVADFGMGKPVSLHLRPGEQATLYLSQNHDILQTVGMHPTQRPPVVIGFAAETHDLLTHAQGKLERKGADAICANQVSGAFNAYGNDRNQITWVSASGNETWEAMDKADIGTRIGNKVASLLGRKAA